MKVNVSFSVFWSIFPSAAFVMQLLYFRVLADYCCFTVFFVLSVVCA